MRALLLLLQLLFTTALVGGFWLWWMLDHVGHGYPPEGGFLRWWHELDGQPEFYLLFAQLIYPLYWRINRDIGWSPFWRRFMVAMSAPVLFWIIGPFGLL